MTLAELTAALDVQRREVFGYLDTPDEAYRRKARIPLFKPTLGTDEVPQKTEDPTATAPAQLVLFPSAVAYAMVRYDLFDVLAVVRLGTIYGFVTGVVIAAYAGAITLLSLIFTRLGMGSSPLATAVVLALAVVRFLNSVYVAPNGWSSGSSSASASTSSAHTS